MELAVNVEGIKPTVTVDPVNVEVVIVLTRNVEATKERTLAEIVRIDETVREETLFVL
jgi:hypothetical protein